MEMDGSLRRYAWVALAAMAILCIGGGVFFKERLLFCDASYIAYNVIEYQRLLIQEGRIGSFITQGVPLLAVKAGLPIAATLFLYAFSFNFIYMAAATLLFRLRQYALVVLMALFYTLLVTDTWYWTNNEIHQAVMWFFMLVGSTIYMVRQRTSWLVLIPVFVVLAVLSIHTHFIVLLPLGFLLVYLWLKGVQGLDVRKFGIGALLLVAIIALKMANVGAGSYEQSHLHNLAHLSLGDVGRAVASHTVKMFALRMFTLYWPVFIIGGLGLAALLRGRQYKLLSWWLASVGGYVLLMGITYDNSYGDILLFHIESEWQAAGILIAAPFVINWLPQARLQTGLLLLCAVFVVRFVYIGASLPAFRWRVKQTEKILADMRAQKMHKCLLQPDAALQHKYIQWWALTEESLLLSALHGDKPLYTFCFADSTNLLHSQAQQQPGILLTSFSPAGKSKGRDFVVDTCRYKYLLMQSSPASKSVNHDSLEMENNGITEHTYMVIADTGSNLKKLYQKMLQLKSNYGIPIDIKPLFELDGKGSIKVSKASKKSPFIHISRSFGMSEYVSIGYGDTYEMPAEYIVIAGVYHNESSADSLVKMIQPLIPNAYKLHRVNHHM